MDGEELALGLGLGSSFDTLHARGEARIQLNRDLELGVPFHILVRLDQRETEIQVGTCVVRLDLDGLPIKRDRLFQIP